MEPPGGTMDGWLSPSSLTTGVPHFAYPDPQVAVDNHGDSAAIWDDEGFVQVSFRAPGASWQAPVNLSPAGFGTFDQTRVAFDQRGDALAVWGIDGESAETEGLTETLQATERPAGGEWEPAIDLSKGCESFGNSLQPELAVDSHGDALAAWLCRVTEGKNSRTTLQTAYKPAGGAWQSPVDVAQVMDEAAPASPQLAFDSQGNAFLSWANHLASEVAYRPVNGSWQTPTELSEDGGPPQLALDGQGNAYARITAEGGVAVAYRPAGGSWQSAAQVVARSSEGGAEPGPNSPWLAVDAQGEALLTWSAKEGADRVIKAAARPAGAGWQAPVTLSTSAAEDSDTEVAFDSSGDAIAAWEGEAGHTVVQAARRPVGGVWQTPVTLSGGKAFEPQLAIAPQGGAVVAWELNESESVGVHETWAVQVAGFDAGPQLEALSIPASGAAGQPVSLSVSPLGVWSAPGPTKWSFGDGSSATGENVSHTYTAPGTYEVTVEGEDMLGQRSRASQTIDVAPQPAIRALTTYQPTEAQLDTPSAVAVDPSSGDFWVDESAQDRLIEFNPERKFIRQLGEEGTGHGQFMGIKGVATDASGDVFAIDSGNHRVQEFSPEGTYINQFPIPSANAIAVDSQGDVWIDQASSSPGPIDQYSPSGVLKSQFGTSGRAAGQLGYALAMTFSQGNLYVVELSRVQEFEPSGKFVRSFDERGSGNGKSNLPLGIAANTSDGDLYVAEAGNDQVQQFSAEGTFITAFGSAGPGDGQLSDPQGIAVGPSGVVYVADTGNKRVEEWLGIP